MNNYHATGLKHILDGTMLKLAQEHSELVERIAKEKLMTMCGKIPSENELKAHGTITVTPDGWYHMIYCGVLLIEWSRDLRYDEKKNRLVRDYRY